MRKYKRKVVGRVLGSVSVGWLKTQIIGAKELKARHDIDYPVLKSPHTAHMCMGNKARGTKKLVDQKTYQLREPRGPERRDDQAMEGTTKLNLYWKT